MTDSSFINKKSLEKIIFLEMDTLSDEKVNFFEIEKKLHLHPHVKEVKVYKDLTGNLNVSLSQFKPVARIVSGKFSDHYVDKDGIIFPKNFIKLHTKDCNVRSTVMPLTLNGNTNTLL